MKKWVRFIIRTVPGSRVHGSSELIKLNLFAWKESGETTSSGDCSELCKSCPVFKIRFWKTADQASGFQRCTMGRFRILHRFHFGSWPNTCCSGKFSLYEFNKN